MSTLNPNSIQKNTTSKKDYVFLVISIFLVGLLFDRVLIHFFGDNDISLFGIFVGLVINGFISGSLLKKCIGKTKN